MSTEFTGVSFGAVKDRLCVVAKSDGSAIVKPEGFTTREVIAALLALCTKSKAPGKRRAFVAYDFAVDMELALRDLNRADKDMLFGVWRQNEDRHASDTPLYDWNRRADHIMLDGVRMSYLSGKVLRVSYKKQSVALYDIVNYFAGASIGDSVSGFLPEHPPVKRIERTDLALWQPGIIDQMVDRCVVEAGAALKLAERIEQTIEPLELRPRQWYGPSAIASRCLSKWKARRQGKRLTNMNSAYELLKAIDCAYFGGRVEAIKLGTVYGVRVIDLNSAYAYATALLAQFAKPLRFTRDKADMSQPFSIWFCEYDLPGDTVLGVLPTRTPRGSISFRRAGRGYFWQPELEYLWRKFPDCYRVKWGYVARDAERVTFADDIYKMYDYRMMLKANDDAGESIIKLALANLYGKFSQNTGGAFYQCRAWAGWITAYVRRLLLDAVDGIEDRVVAFAQDAVHLDGNPEVRVPIGEGLGEWKQSDYASGLYLAPGIYKLTQDTGKIKTAARGACDVLNFERLAQELSDKQATELERAFFVGYVLASQVAVKYGRQYLTDVNEGLALVPGRLRARHYTAAFNWLKESRTSKINTGFSGNMSARYFPQDQSTSLRLRLKDRG